MSQRDEGRGTRDSELPEAAAPLPPEPPAAAVDRREVLKALGLVPLATVLGAPAGTAERALRALGVEAAVASPEAPQQAPYAPKFFTAREWRTVRVLADYVIPRDERSGSATEAKAPEFVDFMLADKETPKASRVAMRGGLAWLDAECRSRFGTRFVGCTDAQRRQVLDDIAWPKLAKPEYSQGVAFFNRFRDAIAAGFFSSPMGWQDLRYVGNVFNPDWRGCPKPALDKLGVSYEAYEASLAEHRNRS